MRVPRFSASVCLFVGLWAFPARADFVYSDFSNVSGLQLNGAATQVGDVLRLSSATPWNGGGTFSNSQVDLGGGNSFSSYFQFRMTNPGGRMDQDGWGADGLVFVVQTVSNNVGAAGGWIGYSGIEPSLGVEFDTYYNPQFHDPDGNHVGIDLDGNIVSAATASEPTRFNNGEIWNAWVDYDGVSRSLEVRWSMDLARPAASQLTATIDLPAILGQDTAFVGFTSATGDGFENHDLLRWEYRGSYAPIGAVPEPAGLRMLGLGIIGFGIRQRPARRRSTL